MRKLNRIIFSISLIALLLIPNPIFAKEHPTITYDGSSHSFIIENVEDSDLFTDLKSLMPGDARKQTIIIKTVNINKSTQLFLEAEGYIESIGNEIKCKVYQDSKLISDEWIFKPISLGNFTKKQSTTLELELEIPVTSTLNNQEFHIKWNIIAQEDGKEISQPIINTSTKGNNKVFPLILGATLVVGVLLIPNKKNK